MKQFLVTCAVLPLLMILIIQGSMDQIISFEISAVNQAVYAEAQQAKQRGYFDSENLKTVLENIVKERGIVNVEDSGNGIVSRGNLINYRIEVTFKKPMVGMMLSDKDNQYTYVIDSCVASEKNVF